MTVIHNGTALLKKDLNTKTLIVILCFSHTLKLFPVPTIAHKVRITFPGTMLFVRIVVLVLQLLLAGLLTELLNITDIVLDDSEMLFIRPTSST